jgi:hypothetical protein
MLTVVMLTVGCIVLVVYAIGEASGCEHGYNWIPADCEYHPMPDGFTYFQDKCGDCWFIPIKAFLYFPFVQQSTRIMP